MKARGCVPKRGKNPALDRMTTYQRDAMIARGVAKAAKLVECMVLYDKFGFKKEEIETFLLERDKLLVSYDKGNLESVTDLESVLRDEVGIEIEF